MFKQKQHLETITYIVYEYEYYKTYLSTRIFLIFFLSCTKLKEKVRFYDVLITRNSMGENVCLAHKVVLSLLSVLNFFFTSTFPFFTKKKHFNVFIINFTCTFVQFSMLTLLLLLLSVVIVFTIKQIPTNPQYYKYTTFLF